MHWLTNIKLYSYLQDDCQTSANPDVWQSCWQDKQQQMLNIVWVCGGLFVALVILLVILSVIRNHFNHPTISNNPSVEQDSQSYYDARFEREEAKKQAQLEAMNDPYYTKSNIWGQRYHEDEDGNKEWKRPGWW